MTPSAPIPVAASLELLDVARSREDAERFLRIRAATGSADVLPLTPDQLAADSMSGSGETLQVVARDDRLAATLYTIREQDGAGSTYLHIHASGDPGEPILQDVVDLAAQRAQAGDVGDVRAGGDEDDPVLLALRARHSFVELERWRRFHVDPGAPPAVALLPSDALQESGMTLTSVAERADLAERACEVHRDALRDAPGDFPRPNHTTASWLDWLDTSPRRSRDLMLLLVDEHDDVRAVAELARLAAGSVHAEIDLLGVARSARRQGLGRLMKRCALERARAMGITRLQTLVHTANAASIALNEQLGWTVDPDYVTLRLPLSRTSNGIEPSTLKRD